MVEIVVLAEFQAGLTVEMLAGSVVVVVIVIAMVVMAVGGIDIDGENEHQGKRGHRFEAAGEGFTDACQGDSHCAALRHPVSASVRQELTGEVSKQARSLSIFVLPFLCCQVVANLLPTLSVAHLRAMTGQAVIRSARPARRGGSRVAGRA
ncbi:MAG: hypothetical protein OXE80_03465 [Gammaproteobacteria bacterium]|nr:hypothetical protein [Gammaproteobacteria bacterium]